MHFQCSEIRLFTRGLLCTSFVLNIRYIILSFLIAFVTHFLQAPSVPELRDNAPYVVVVHDYM